MRDATTTIDSRDTGCAASWHQPSEDGRWIVRIADPRDRVLAALASALTDMFPATCRLLGEWDFAALVKDYLHGREGSADGDEALAVRFPLFIAMHARVRTSPWATDLARLELALRQVRLEPAVPCLPAARLRQLTVAQLASLRLDLHPGWRMVSSAYPVLAAWRALVSAQPIDRLVVAGGTNVLLGSGGQGHVLLHELRQAELLFLRWLRAGRPVAEAAEAACTAGAPFDTAAAVGHFAGLGILAAPCNPSPLEASLAA